MIKFEEARAEIKKVIGKEAAKQIKVIIEQYNIYIVNGGDIIAARKHKNMENLVWYNDLSACLMSRKDLFEDVSKELEEKEVYISLEDFIQIDNEVDLSKFDYPSAFHLVCKKARESNE